MSVLWILVGVSTLVALGFLAAFIWAARSGQYDDKFTPSVRILFEDDAKKSDISPDVLPPNAEGSNEHGDAHHNVR